MPTKLDGYSSSAASLWGDVMNVVHEGLGYKELDKPSTVVTANVCRDSGKLATDLCTQDQRGSRARTEYFIEGTEPTTACDVHVVAKVNSVNNKLATNSTPASLIVQRVFIKKLNPNPATTDYPYVLPTESDNSKMEVIKLSKLGIKKNMDLYDAILILNNNNINYYITGNVSVPDSISAGQYTLKSFTSEIYEGQSVELTVEKTTGISDILDSLFPNNSNNNSNGNNSNNDNDDDNSDNDDNLIDIPNTGLFD